MDEADATPLTPNPVRDPLAADLDHVLAHTSGLWEELRGRRLFLTGGTGFFGCWLLESFLQANDRLGLGAGVAVLTRAPEAFRRKVPHLAGHPAVELHQGNVCDFGFPPGRFAYLIHGAAEPSAPDPLCLLDAFVGGTRRTLEFACRAGVQKCLLISSGAAYGPQPPDVSHLPEEYPGAPDPADPCSAYGNGKRSAEQTAALFHQRHGLATKVARCFSFLGPYQPLDGHFAAGNFLRDGLLGGPIRVKGDGTALRSYLHAADLAVWLWTILFRGAPGRSYNVGSEDAVSVGELARRVARLSGADVVIERTRAPGLSAERYVPSTRRAAGELGLRTRLGLDESLARTMHWCRQQPTLSSGDSDAPPGPLLERRSKEAHQHRHPLLQRGGQRRGAS
jgi:dTDP-glucose 4,6-dehydratase